MLQPLTPRAIGGSAPGRLLASPAFAAHRRAKRGENAGGALAEAVDLSRILVSRKLDPDRRAALGQYMTPISVARFMASLFTKKRGDLRVLDPGAGIGSLTVALTEQLIRSAARARTVEFVCFEIDSLLSRRLRAALRRAETQFASAGISMISRTINEDFILEHADARGTGLFADHCADDGFTHAILNPPYRKIRIDSPHRSALRRAGLETSNLYTGFMFLAAKLLRNGGEMVAIVPRSFCNGPYFRSFRQQFFSMMRLRRIHVFQKRNRAFRDDDVIQENVIVHAIKGAGSKYVTISTSGGSALAFDAARGACVAEDMTQRTASLNAVVRGDDRVVHIAADGIDQRVFDRMACFSANLEALDVDVSTGPVVDYRLKEDLRVLPTAGAAPLLYPAHFERGRVRWPRDCGKPNAIRVSGASIRRLWKNEGSYVVVKRLTSKEERKRIVASIYESSLPGKLVGFENHLNVLHMRRGGMPEGLAKGLALFLNCSLVDRYFRQYSGHTQVNATDLRRMRYPDYNTLLRLGRRYDTELSQLAIDKLIEKEIQDVAHNEDPLAARRKIDDAVTILRALGMPRSQQNDRSALTLLALVGLGPSGSWSRLKRPLMGITPIMDYARESYGLTYAPNTREAFRRHTMHQLVESGIARFNPDDPARPVNSPRACYQISKEALQTIKEFGTPGWNAAVERWLSLQAPLAEKQAQDRAMRMVPVRVSKNRDLALTPGSHSRLIRDVISSFAPRFTPGALVVYVGDPGGGLIEEKCLAGLGLDLDRHGKLPDVVLYFKKKNWLVLVEAVTSHGPVNVKRYNELTRIFGGAKAGLVYVTAFPDRTVMGRHLSDLSWGTEVWCADAPSHLIHFDGKRFFGPLDPIAEK